MTSSKDKETPFEWTPEEFGFNCVRRHDTYEGCIWRKGAFELRYLGNNYWLCRKSRNKGDVQEQVVNFCKEIRPEDIEFAEWLLYKRL